MYFHRLEANSAAPRALLCVSFPKFSSTRSQQLRSKSSPLCPLSQVFPYICMYIVHEPRGKPLTAIKINFPCEKIHNRLQPGKHQTIYNILQCRQYIRSYYGTLVTRNSIRKRNNCTPKIIYIFNIFLIQTIFRRLFPLF